MPITIKVLGPGCNNCHLVEENAKAAVAQLGLDAEIEHVTDRAEYPKYGLLFTPGLVIDDKLVSGGRIPSSAEVATWLASAAQAD
jgi:small redox-active disulfide protein 2